MNLPAPAPVQPDPPQAANQAVVPRRERLPSVNLATPAPAHAPPAAPRSGLHG